MMLSYESGCDMEIEKTEINEKKDYDKFRVKLRV